MLLVPALSMAQRPPVPAPKPPAPKPGVERVRYLDPATEFEVFRLTDPGAGAAYLPPTSNPVISRRGGFLLYVGDRGGSLQAWTLDLKTYQSRLITAAQALDRKTVCLTPDERSVCYVDGDAVMICPLAGGKGRPLLRPQEPVTGLSVIPDGPSVLVAESTRIRAVSIARGVVRTVVENGEGVLTPLPRPRRASLVYQDRQSNCWLAHLDGSRNVKLRLSPGRIGPARWSADGRTLLYLHFPSERGKVNSLREHNPDTGEDKLIAGTSQFVAFSPNRDASVFVGSSGAKAGPYVLILLRVVGRELALCEHKASDPSAVAPIFSPDSQNIYFESDRHGKPALYSMRVDKLIEKTEDEEAQTASETRP